MVVLNAKCRKIYRFIEVIMFIQVSEETAPKSLHWFGVIYIYICVYTHCTERERLMNTWHCFKRHRLSFSSAHSGGWFTWLWRWSPMCQHFSTKFAQREIQCTCADSRAEDTLSLWDCGHCTSMTHCTEWRNGLRGFKGSSVELVIIHYMFF